MEPPSQFCLPSDQSPHFRTLSLRRQTCALRRARRPPRRLDANFPSPPTATITLRYIAKKLKEHSTASRELHLKQAAPEKVSFLTSESAHVVSLVATRPRSRQTRRMSRPMLAAPHGRAAIVARWSLTSHQLRMQPLRMATLTRRCIKYGAVWRVLPSRATVPKVLGTLQTRCLNVTIP